MSILAKIPDASGCGMTKKWVPRPLVTVCGVCSSPATDVQHYGSVSCYSCRAFFRRSVGGGKEFKVCSRGSDDCIVDSINRTNCKKCRYRKCIQIGMRPEKVDRTSRKRNQIKLESTDETEALAHSTSRQQSMPFYLNSSNSIVKSPSPTGQSPNSEVTKGSLLLDSPNSMVSSPSQLVPNLSNMVPSPLQFVLSPNSMVPSLSPQLQSQNSTPTSPSPEAIRVSVIKRRLPLEVRDLEASCSQMATGSFDMGSLVDDCFADAATEAKDMVITDVTDVGLVVTDLTDMITNIPAMRCHEAAETSTNHLGEMAVIGTTAATGVVPICPSPDLALTFEEEFKIQQLMVMKENLISKGFEHFRKLPRFQENFRSFFQAINQEQKGIRLSIPLHLMELIIHKFPGQFDKISRYMGLDLFEDFSSIDTTTKAETMAHSLTTVQLCVRAYIQANKDKKYLVPQYIAAGSFHKAIQLAYEAAVPGGRENLYLVKSFDPLSLHIFTSPWAINYSDEVKFEKTMTTLGELVKEDVKLGTLYVFLILVTPGPNATHSTRNHPLLNKIRRDLVLLIHRYLKNKYQCSDTANFITSKLLSLVEDLHECREIHLHRRLSGSYEELMPDFEQVLCTQDLIFGQRHFSHAASTHDSEQTRCELK